MNSNTSIKIKQRKGKVLLLSEIVSQLIGEDILIGDHFNLRDRLEYILRIVCDYFNINNSIMRKLSKGGDNDSDLQHFEVLASYGVDYEILKTAVVDQNKRMVKYLKNNPSKRFYYLPNIFDNRRRYDQKQLARELGVNSALVCPMWVNCNLYGFVIYFKIDKSAFSNEEIDFLQGPFNDVLRMFIVQSITSYKQLEQKHDLYNREKILTDYLLSELHTAKANIRTSKMRLNQLAKYIVQCDSDLNKDRVMCTVDKVFYLNNNSMNILVNAVKIDEVELIDNILFMIEDCAATALLLQPLAKKSIRIIKDIHTEELSIHAKPRLLRQVFYNVFQNSVDAITETKKKDGLITISLFSDDISITILISDNGPGMDSSTLRSATSKYFTTKKRNSGTGLGLYVSKQIIQVYHAGGSFDISSEIDKGTTVAIKLPRTMKIA